MPQPAGATPMLSYAVKPRRRWRRYLLGFVLILLVDTGVHWRTLIPSRITHLYWQHRVETFEYPKGTVVFEVGCRTTTTTPIGWSTVPDLLQKPEYTPVHPLVRLGDAGAVGAALINLEMTRSHLFDSQRLLTSDGWNAGLLYIGPRRSQSGNDRLLLVCPIFEYEERNVILECGVVKMAGLSDPQNFADAVVFPNKSKAGPPLSITCNGTFRAFGGQRDPANSSRFTIDYETATEKGTIIGVLQDDGSVTFSIVKR